MKKIFRLENLIYLTIFALPVYLWRFSFFNMLDILLGGCIIGGLLIYHKKFSPKTFFDKYRAIIFSAGLILAGLVISVLWNKNYAVGFGIVKSWFLLPVLFSMVVGGVIEKERLRNIFFAYYLSAFLVALISLAYYFSGMVTFDLRLQGFFNSPNYLAMYLAPAIFIGWSLFQETALKRKPLFVFLALVIFLALYLTRSYATWLALFGALVFVFVLEKKLNWKKALATLLFLCALFFSQMGEKKLTDLLSFNERSSLESRIMIWRSAEKMLENSWLLGIGAGNFQTKYLENQKYFSPYLEWAVAHPHNLYLTFWLYGGIFGAAGFFALIYFWFLGILRTQKNSQLRFIGLGIMGYILLCGLVDTTYFKNDLAVVFWLLFVLL